LRFVGNPGNAFRMSFVHRVLKLIACGVGNAIFINWGGFTRSVLVAQIKIQSSVCLNVQIFAPIRFVQTRLFIMAKILAQTLNSRLHVQIKF